MPWYTYICPSCDAQVEELRDMDDRNKDLPVCSNHDTRVVMQHVINPVAGIVRNPAVPKRSKS